MKKILLTLFCVFLSQNSLAQGFTPMPGKAPQTASSQMYDVGAMMPSMRKIATGHGKITKAEYDAFWGDLGLTTTAQKSQVIGVMRQNFLAVQDYQKELWKCAKQAWITQKVPACERAQAKLVTIRKNMKDSGQSPMLQSMETQGEEVLNAAAKRSTIKAGNGFDLQLSLEVIEDTSRTVEQVFSRFDQVLSVEYKK